MKSNPDVRHLLTISRAQYSGSRYENVTKWSVRKRSGDRICFSVMLENVYNSWIIWSYCEQLEKFALRKYSLQHYDSSVIDRYGLGSKINLDVLAQAEYDAARRTVWEQGSSVIDRLTDSSISFLVKVSIFLLEQSERLRPEDSAHPASRFFLEN